MPSKPIVLTSSKTSALANVTVKHNAGSLRESLAFIRLFRILNSAVRNRLSEYLTIRLMVGGSCCAGFSCQLVKNHRFGFNTISMLAISFRQLLQGVAGG